MSPVDELLEGLRLFSELILPTLGAFALIALIVLLIRLCGLVKEATQRIKELQPTLKNVDMSIEKIQAPLDTAVNLAHSVDKAQESCEKAVHQASVYISEQLDSLKNNLQTMKAEREAAKASQSIENQEGDLSHE
ncbi:MAG: hypothetical protein E7192_03670 [Erysipelotrichaceae bacterium]|nr:hypothetical protein [Erysipelotrichaceae bacterium]MBQ4343831.1 hypothetical protein [Erysipelotrichaceae bacterium]